MPNAESSPALFSRLKEFNRYFDLSVATTRKLRDQVYQIRYQVYCEEFGYEPIENFSNHQEMDEFDCQSVHCLATHRESGTLAGCVRVVMLESNDRMPMEVHVGDYIDQSFIDGFADQRHTLCEISRLAVGGEFRRRRREGRSRFGDIESIGASAPERRTFPLVALTLMLGAGAVADILGRKNCFAIMEPFLPIMMRRAGINFRRVGADFAFRGVRAPYYGNMDKLIGNAPEELRQYFGMVRAQFASVMDDVPVVASSPESARSSESEGCGDRPGRLAPGRSGQGPGKYSCSLDNVPDWPGTRGGQPA